MLFRFVVLILSILTATQVHAQSTAAQRNTLGILCQFSPEISAYYARSLLRENTAEFTHQGGFRFGMHYPIFANTCVSASFSLDRQFGAPIERFSASNTTLSVMHLLNLGDGHSIRPSVYGLLPTRADDRRYLTYRGSIGTNVAYNKLWRFFGDKHIVGPTVTLFGERHLYAYDANIAGGLNRLWSLGALASIDYTFAQRLSTGVGFRTTLLWNRESRDSNRYDVVTYVSYRVTPEFFVTLSAVTADSAFQNEQLTSNVRLYKSDRTMGVLTFTYTPVIKR